MIQENLRNVAIIAHVDHGKTTLVDQMLKQSGAFRANQQVAERVMDSGDIERERGITILAKNCSCEYNGVKINIVDTPGHADFGGEVERVLKMVNGVLLLVDAAEGCMPQTRFVLQKALQQNLSLVIAVNKIDRPDARIAEVIDEILELLMDLGATDEQLDSPMVFCSGRNGTASYDWTDPASGTDLKPLFDTILKYVQPPEGEPDEPLQMLVSSVDYNDFVGRMGVGRVQNGVIKVGSPIQVCDWHNPDVHMSGRITKLFDFKANGREPIESAQAGDIVAFAGLPDISIGNTICDPSKVQPLPFVKINDPTVEMTFSVNDSPFAGKEGKYVTSRQIRDRLMRELLKDVALKVEDSATNDSFRVMGRGEMHLSILIETMRREGYEFQVSPPRVLYQEIDGVKCEPMERLVVDVPSDSVGAVIEKIGSRKGDLLEMLCALGFTGHILVVDHFSPKVDGVKMSCIQFFACGILAGIFMLILEEPSWENICAAAVPILYAGILSSGAGYTLQIVAQKDTQPTVASLLMSLESVFSLIFGWILLKEAMSGVELLGCVLMFAAIIWVQLPEKQKKTA